MSPCPKPAIIRLAVFIAALAAASAAQSGGLCIGAECGEAAPVHQFAPAPDVAMPGSSLARQVYDEGLSGLWKSDANGTCLGTLGAWKLTPYHVIAQGKMFEIASVTGTAARIAVVARRVNDGAGAQFIFVPRSRNRVDVSGTVFNDTDHYLGALRRCRRGME